MEKLTYTHNADAAAVIAQTYDTPPLAYVRSYGCQQNVNDGEKIRGVLMDIGFGICDSVEQADLILFNTCAVREHAEQRVFGNVGALKKLQFAWRFFTPATMLLVVCACCAVVLYRKVRPEAAKAMAAVLLALTIIPAGYLMYDKCTTSEAVPYMSLAAVDDLPGQVGGGEYLPTEDTTTDDSVWGRLTPEADDGVELTEYTKNGLTIQLAAQNTGDTEASIRLPLFYYPGYHMTAADGAALTHKDGYLTVTLAPGWQGSVQVRWTGMWFWRAADCISLLGIAATVVLYRKSQKNAAHV